MKKSGIFMLIVLSLLFPNAVDATNGDNLISVGPISRSMGGVGIAYPQDAIGAVFANPAAMCFGPICNVRETDFAGTVFMPEVEAEVKGPSVGGTNKADSDDQAYSIPAIGVSVPITDAPPNWRFGLAAYGVSGLGVDYRETDLDQPDFYGQNLAGDDVPLVAGEFTQLQILRFAPAIAVQPFSQWSFGLALQIDYSSLDLRSGSGWDYGVGLQIGTIYNLSQSISMGLNYVTPRNVDHEKVTDFDGDGTLDDLELASPQEIGFGIAYHYGRFLVETDLKWLNWSDAKGYKDFDWEDQWVFGIGGQFEAIPNLFLRVGYNYGKNPVEENDGFDGSIGGNGIPNSFREVQGKSIPEYFYESFRVIGFPGIVEHHLTFGVGYDVTPTFSVNLGYVYGFENTIKETGTGLNGQPVTFESTLKESSFDFGVTWKF